MGALTYGLLIGEYNQGAAGRARVTKEKEQQIRRVTFDKPPSVLIMAIDGTWKRHCLIKDISEVDATLHVEGTVEALSLKEFFLLLSSTGLAFRRCELQKVDGEMIEVSFIGRQKKKPSPKQEAAA